jgi:hypothetical protein
MALLTELRPVVNRSIHGEARHSLANVSPRWGLPVPEPSWAICDGTLSLPAWVTSAS